MALLLDLTELARRELADAWAIEDSGAAALYRTMTDRARLAELTASQRSAAARLARSPASFDDLLARLPVSRGALEADLDRLGRLGLVLWLSPELRPRLVRAPFGSKTLYVPSDVLAPLG